MAYQFIQVGTGGQGAAWCRDFLPPNVEDGLIEPVAAVDVDPDAHENAVEGLGLDPEDCYTDAEEAFAAHPEADFTTNVVPPWFHEEIIDAAVAHDLHVLSEKPIADTLEASVRIAEKIERAGLKMGVTMSHRFDQDKTTLRREIRKERSGPLDYLVGRFTCSARSYGAWGDFRHEMDDALLVEGGVHQLDFIADMAGAPCESIYARTWTPEWAEFEGDCNAHVEMTFENGTTAFWEGAKSNAVTLNGWGNDYLRAECRENTLILDGRELYRHAYDPEEETVVGNTDEHGGEEIELLEGEKWSNTWLIEQFVDWLDGGPEMETNVTDNLQSMALVEGAIRSSERGEPVAVQEYLEATREDVEV